MIVEPALTESEKIVNGLVILCTNGFHTVRAGSGFIVAGGPLFIDDHTRMERFGWFFDKYLGRWEYSVLPVGMPPDGRNAVMKQR